jgi:hypothetical protein
VNPIANKEHLKLLKRGVDGWNAWRRKERSTKLDLSDAKLSRADLSGLT